MRNITICKVVSRNFIVDFFSGIQNILGKNLTGYEKMMATAIEQINKEISDKKIELAWYRYEMTQLTNGAIAVILYGDAKQ